MGFLVKEYLKNFNVSFNIVAEWPQSALNDPKVTKVKNTSP